MKPMLAKKETADADIECAMALSFCDDTTCGNRNDALRLVERCLAVRRGTSFTRVARETTDDN